MNEDKKQEETLYQKLETYGHSDFYPFHMPGHKRNSKNVDTELLPFSYDITEIDGFDNLHHPEDILKSRMEAASLFYQSRKSYYLINGSTCGIMAAISAATEKNKTILMARNSHKASYHTCFLLNLNIVYIYPEYKNEYGINGDISPEQIQETLENCGDIGAVFLTSPTYEGVVCDIKKIAEIVHKKGIPLIVDEAHGAHFGLHSYFPESALMKDADVVIQSLHKTLPSLTQTAILHVGKDSRIDTNTIEHYLQIYQTSSPSYILMSSIDWCMEFIRDKREPYYDSYVSMLEEFRQKCKNLKHFSLLSKENWKEMFDYDRSKLVIIPEAGYDTGKELYVVLLEKYHLQMEMAAECYVIAMTSVFDTREGLNRLYDALRELDEETEIRHEEGRRFPGMSIMPVVCKTIREAYEANGSIVPLKDAVGKISKEFVYLYPPGIPILVPGEVFTEEILYLIERYKKEKLPVQGLSDSSVKNICVVKEI